MKYLTGIHALNINCNLETTGDWHQSALRWKDLQILESEGSLFGDYGIECDKTIPNHNKKYNIANHIRALLDIIEQGKFSVAGGMNNDYISNEKYDEEIFSKVYEMRNKDNWKEIDQFMNMEYFMKWVNYKMNEDEITKTKDIETEIKEKRGSEKYD